MRQTLKVSKPRRLAPRTGTPIGISGDIIIKEMLNADGTIDWTKTVVLSNRDFQNSLSNMDLPTNLRLTVLQGASVSWEEYNITQEMLTAGGGAHTYKSHGREITARTVGIKNINMTVDTLPNLVIDENEINIVRMKNLAQESRLARTRVQAPPRPVSSSPEVIDENIEVPPTTVPPVVTPPVQGREEEVIHDDLATS